METRAAIHCLVLTCSKRTSRSQKFFLSRERINLQFRAEFFNLFNHTNLNTPNPVVYASASGGPSPTAGVITSTATTSRQINWV